MAKPSDPTWHSQVREPISVADPEATSWDEEADLVVVGFGGAGAAAATEAAQHGAKAIVIDRYLGGGATSMSGGILYAGERRPGWKDAVRAAARAAHATIERARSG